MLGTLSVFTRVLKVGLHFESVLNEQVWDSRWKNTHYRG